MICVESKSKLKVFRWKKSSANREWKTMYEQIEMMCLKCASHSIKCLTFYGSHWLIIIFLRLLMLDWIFAWERVFIDGHCWSKLYFISKNHHKSKDDFVSELAFFSNGNHTYVRQIPLKRLRERKKTKKTGLSHVICFLALLKVHQHRVLGGAKEEHCRPKALKTTWEGKLNDLLNCSRNGGRRILQHRPGEWNC